MVEKVLRPCCLAVLSWCKCSFMSGEIWKILPSMPGTAITPDGSSVSSSKARNAIDQLKYACSPNRYFKVITKALLEHTNRNL